MHLSLCVLSYRCIIYQSSLSYWNIFLIDGNTNTQVWKLVLEVLGSLLEKLRQEDFGKGQMGSALMGSLQFFMFFDRGSFGYSTYFYLPRSARAYLFPHSVKIRYLCGGPISVDPIRPQPRTTSSRTGRRRCCSRTCSSALATASPPSGRAWSRSAGRCSASTRGSTTPNLPTNITPTQIAWVKLSGKFPMGLGIPPLKIKIMLE